MIIRYIAICTVTFLAAFALEGTSAHALSMKSAAPNTKRPKTPERSTA